MTTSTQQTQQSTDSDKCDIDIHDDDTPLAIFSIITNGLESCYFNDYVANYKVSESSHEFKGIQLMKQLRCACAVIPNEKFWTRTLSGPIARRFDCILSRFSSLCELKLLVLGDEIYQNQMKRYCPKEQKLLKHLILNRILLRLTPNVELKTQLREWYESLIIIAPNHTSDDIKMDSK